MLTAPDGTVIGYFSYDAWGQRRDPTDWSGPATNPAPDTTERGYTGHKMLDEVGLIHMNGRVYDPAIGRFVSADPFIQAPYFSQSFNRYSYVWNNPLSAVDPSGFLMNFAQEEPFKLPDMTVSGGSAEYWRNYWNMWWLQTFGTSYARNRAYGTSGRDPYSIVANGRELNPDGYVLSNWKLREAIKETYLGLLDRVGNDDFVFQVTGGDRYIDPITGEHKSATNNLTVDGSSPTSPHLAENGARAADLRVKGVSNKDFDSAAADAGLPKYNTIRNYDDAHTHVGLPNVPANYPYQ